MIQANVHLPLSVSLKISISSFMGHLRMVRVL